MPLLFTKLIESKAAQAYPEELRIQAVKLAMTYAWFDPLAYLWLFGSILVPLTFPWMLGSDLRASVFDAFKFVPVLLTSMLIIPIFIGRRALVIRKDKILRVLQGGYNGSDKGREIPSQK